jgi:hypothetical protein
VVAGEEHGGLVVADSLEAAVLVKRRQLHVVLGGPFVHVEGAPGRRTQQEARAGSFLPHLLGQDRAAQLLVLGALGRPRPVGPAAVLLVFREPERPLAGRQAERRRGAVDGVRDRRVDESRGHARPEDVEDDGAMPADRNRLERAQEIRSTRAPARRQRLLAGEREQRVARHMRRDVSEDEDERRIFESLFLGMNISDYYR